MARQEAVDAGFSSTAGEGEKRPAKVLAFFIYIW
jgi:hypothetical protein